MNLRIKLVVYDEDTSETLENRNTYVTYYQDTGRVDFESAEIELGSMQRNLEKVLSRLQDNKEQDESKSNF